VLALLKKQPQCSSGACAFFSNLDDNGLVVCNRHGLGVTLATNKP